MFSFPLGSGAWKTLEIELSQVPYLLESLDCACKMHRIKDTGEELVSVICKH